MSILKFKHLECDNKECGIWIHTDNILYSLKNKDIFKVAKVLGWSITKHGHFCPKCKSLENINIEKR